MLFVAFSENNAINIRIRYNKVVWVNRGRLGRSPIPGLNEEGIDARILETPLIHFDPISNH